MHRKLSLTLLLGGSLALGGCAASLAASAVGAAMRSAQGRSPSNEHLTLEAAQACRAQAARYGEVHVIDVEQRTTSKIIVYGTATSGADRRSFECTYTTKVVAFRVRPISG